MVKKSIYFRRDIINLALLWIPISLAGAYCAKSAAENRGKRFLGLGPVAIIILLGRMMRSLDVLRLYLDIGVIVKHI